MKYQRYNLGGKSWKTRVTKIQISTPERQHQESDRMPE